MKTLLNAHGIARIGDFPEDYKTRIGQLENLELGQKTAQQVFVPKNKSRISP